MNNQKKRKSENNVTPESQPQRKRCKLDHKLIKNHKISNYFKSLYVQSLRKCDQESNQNNQKNEKIISHASEKNDNDEKKEIESNCNNEHNVQHIEPIELPDIHTNNSLTNIVNNKENNDKHACVKCKQEMRLDTLPINDKNIFEYIETLVCRECETQHKTYTIYQCNDSQCTVKQKKWKSKSAFISLKNHMMLHHANEQTLKLFNQKYCDSEQCMQIIEEGTIYCKECYSQEHTEEEKKEHQENITPIIDQQQPQKYIILDGNKEEFNVYDVMFKIDFEYKLHNTEQKHKAAKIFTDCVQKLKKANTNIRAAIDGLLALRLYPAVYHFLSNRGDINRRKNEIKIREKLYYEKKWGQLMRRIKSEQQKRNARMQRKNHEIHQQNNKNDKENKNKEKERDMDTNVSDQIITVNEHPDIINENTLNANINQMKYNDNDTRKDIQKRIKRCEKYVRSGKFKKGMNSLGEGTIANLNINNNWQKTQYKFPQEQPIQPNPRGKCGISLTLEQIENDIKNLNTQASGGNIGIDNKLIQFILIYNDIYEIKEKLKGLCIEICNKGMPAVIRDLLMHAQGLPLGKAKHGQNDFDIRPIVICNSLVRLLDKIIINAISETKLRNAIGGSQMINIKAGIEIATAGVRMASKMIEMDSNMCLINIDAKNAFNSVSRNQQYKHIQEALPELQQYYLFLYGHSNLITFDTTHVIEMESGDIQGLMSSVIFYAISKHKIQQQTEKKMIQKYPEFRILYQTDYVDDGLTMILSKYVKPYIDTLEQHYKHNGILLNQSKSKIIMNTINRDIRKNVQQELSQFDVIFTGNFTYLGVQHGQKTYINSKLNQLCQKLEIKLLYVMTINDKQIQQLLLRKFMDYNKVIFTLKTAVITNEWLTRLDSLYDDISKIITKHINFTNTMKYQMALPVKAGGFGLRRPSEHIFASKITALTDTCRKAESFFVFLDEAKKQENQFNNNFIKSYEWAQSVENSLLTEMIQKFTAMIAPYDTYVYDPKHKHRELLNLIEKKYTYLFNMHGSNMDNVRHKSQSMTGCNSWLNVIPNNTYGTQFSNREMHVLLSLYLGAPIGAKEQKCMKCNKICDIYGSHALQCSKDGHVIKRHDYVRDRLAQMIEDAGFEVQIEQRYDSNSERIDGRPGDILIKHWKNDGTDLYIDIVISNTISQSNIHNSKNTNINHRKERMKEKKYKNQDNIVAFAIETHGSLGKDATRILQKVSEKTAMRKNKKYSWMMNILRTKITASVMKHNASMILNSIHL